MESLVKRSLDSYLSNLIDALTVARDEDAIRFALKRLAKDAGFEHYAYIELGAGGDRIFSSYPDVWLLRCAAEDYHRIDPALAEAARTMQPVTWSHAQTSRNSFAVQKYFQEARGYGVVSGISLPIRGGFGTKVVLTLASGHDQSHPIAVRDASYAATAVAVVYSSLHGLGLPDQGNIRIPLSPRELHCLGWASMGKTKGEIGRVLDLSESTVRFYLDHARQKLGASNIPHAVRIAVTQNLL